MSGNRQRRENEIVGTFSRDQARGRIVFHDGRGPVYLTADELTKVLRVRSMVTMRETVRRILAERDR